MTRASAFQRLFSLYSVRSIRTLGAVVVCLLVSASGLLFGQATGSISGTIRDASGSAVPGANVTVKAPATGVTRSSVTNAGGEYIVPLLGVAI
jgi:hypothetical protein